MVICQRVILLCLIIFKHHYLVINDYSVLVNAIYLFEMPVSILDMAMFLLLHTYTYRK